jgi:diguanylate cyclase (GGDEF)-like protein
MSVAFDPACPSRMEWPDETAVEKMEQQSANGTPLSPMKELVSAFVLFLAAALPSHAAKVASATDGPITSLAVLHTLGNDQASRTLPVAFEGVVTYYRRGNDDLFVQDGEDSIYVDTRPDLNVVLGDRVLITGHTHASFRPEIEADSVRFLRRDTVPAATTATFRQMIRGDLDTRRVAVRGLVVSSDLLTDAGSQKLYLQVLMDSGSIDAEAPYDGSIKPADLLDAEVELTGAVAGKFDYKIQMTGILLQIPSLAGVQILRPAAERPSSLPVTPMDRVITGYDVQERSQRVHIQGTVTYYQPGSALVLEDGGKSLWVMTQYEQPMAIGQKVDVTGFPTVHNGSLALARGEVEDRGGNAPIAPAELNATELNEGMHAFDLVSVEGRLLMAVRDSGQDQYVLVSDGHLYSAVLRHREPDLGSQPQPFKKVAIGSKVRMTGICVVENGDRYLGPVAFEVLLRTPEDIAVVRSPSLLSVDNLIGVVVFLLLVILAVAARQWFLERRVRRQTTELAYVEKRRRLILEDINASRPLPEILDQITELVSYGLRGAPCWCDLADGTRFGNRPANFTGLRTVEFPIQKPGGSPLGVLYVAFHHLTQNAANEDSTLSMAAALVILALETHRLYSDLIHRSEFDLLTEINNRFSFEKRLNAMLRDYSGTGRVFGLIFLDFDGFKQLNDQYGHQVGDLYLGAAAARMKKQIRPSDLLARIGGDEFALLVSDITHRDDVVEIAGRVKDCFAQPFSIEGHQLDGAASLGIAFYPDDGTTKDELLSAADTAMYAEKNSRKCFREYAPPASPYA